MRYSLNQRVSTRARIVAAASRMFRARGYRGTGVGALMKAAGMTAGGFYAHFPSKKALFRESLAASFHDFRKRLSGEIGGRGSFPLSELVRRYFDVERTAEAGEGCPIASLSPDVARSGEEVRESFEEELRKTAEALAARLKRGLSADEAALALLALCSGAILLRRAVRSPELGDHVFEACLRFAEQAAGRSN